VLNDNNHSIFTSKHEILLQSFISDFFFRFFVWDIEKYSPLKLKTNIIKEKHFEE